MALSLLPQPKSVKMLVGHFDFKEVDTILFSKRASLEVKNVAQLLADELKANFHFEYQVKASATVSELSGLLLTHHAREGFFVKTALNKPQAYELLAAGHALSISAVDVGGLFAATRTLRQLLQEGSRIPAMKIQDWPSVRARILHLDLKGLTPNPDALRELIEWAAIHKLNTLLVEYADRFPYASLQPSQAPNAFTPEGLQAFRTQAAKNGLAIIPLFSLWGPWDFLLNQGPFRGLRSQPEVPHFLDHSRPEAQKLVQKMLREVLAAHPDSTHFHLGGGASFDPGPLPKGQLAREPVELKKRSKLFLEPLFKAIRQVKALGRHALVWDDCLAGVPGEVMAQLPRDTGIVCRSFEPGTGQFKAELVPALATFRGMGLQVYGGAAVKGVTSFYANIPHYRHRMDNLDWWVEAAEVQGSLAGVVATASARHRPDLTPSEPLPVAFYSILYAAERMWTGLGSSRESFERRALVSLYGMPAEATELVDAHYALCNGHPGNARDAIRQLKRTARRNREVLELLELFAELDLINHERQYMVENIGAMLPQLEAGQASPTFARDFKLRLPVLTRKIEHLQKELTAVLGRYFHPTEVQEFVQNRLLLCDRMLCHLRELMKRN